MANIGLPSLNIIFIQKATTMIERSEKGIVSIILKDDTVTGDSFVYTEMETIKEEWSEENKKYLEFLFLGKPKKVFVERIASETTSLETVLKKISNRKWNYLAFPQATTAENTEIVAFIKKSRTIDHKIYKYVGAGLENADSYGIINWDSDKIEVETVKYSKQKYTSRIAGICAGISLDKSLTYYELPEVEGFEELADDTARNEAISQGKLIAINDGEKIKIARGVNSFVTTTKNEKDLFKKIRIIEIIDSIQEDISTTIRDNWVGKVSNTYNNKLLLIASIKSYLKILENEDLLDTKFNNDCTISLTGQKEYLRSIGVKVEDLSNDEILSYNTDDKVFLEISIKTIDTMEDFNVEIFI